MAFETHVAVLVRQALLMDLQKMMRLRFDEF